MYVQAKLFSTLLDAQSTHYFASCSFCYQCILDVCIHMPGHEDITNFFMTA